MSNYAQHAIDQVRAELPDIDPDLVRAYALLLLLHGDGTILEDVHDAQAICHTDIDPDHRSLVPFGELTANAQEAARPHRDAIQRAWNRIEERQT